jgi:hypothetical protein
MKTDKEGRPQDQPLFVQKNAMGSTEEKIVVAGTVGNDGRVKQLTATGTFPGIERPDEVIEFFREHSAFAFWTFHNVSPSMVWLSSFGLLGISPCVPNRGN